MALDSDEEWLNELLEPKPKRQRNSDDDIEAAEFLHEMLTSFSSARSCVQPSLHVAPVPKQMLAQPALPTAVPAPLAARRCVSTVRIADRQARPADRMRVSNINNCVAAVSRKPVEAEQQNSFGIKPVAAQKVKFSLSPSSNAGTILNHAMQLVQNIIGQGPTIFKIGITADPAGRWGNDKYGYQHDRDNYQQMLVLSEAESAGAAMLEASLINKFKSISGCRNTAPGGESVRNGCTTFTYIVFRHLDTRSTQH